MASVKHPIKITGVGIHSGAPVTMIINPSNAHGIFFHRADLGGPLIGAAWDNVGDNSLRNTTIGKSPYTVSTIEHLMAALFMAGIDAAVIEIDGPEVPIMDGSASELYKILNNAVANDSVPKQIIIKREIIVKKSEVMRQIPFVKRMMVLLHDRLLGRRNNGYVKLSPDSRGLVIDATFDYPDKIIGRQSAEYIFNGTPESISNFVENFAAARTFGRYSEWEYLKSRGMARGANEGNVIALNDKGDGTINSLRWPDEFVRHQVIDVLGDMFTSGGMIVGKIELYKGGHAMSNMALRKLFSNPENYEIRDC